MKRHDPPPRLCEVLLLTAALLSVGGCGHSREDAPATPPGSDVLLSVETTRARTPSPDSGRVDVAGLAGRREVMQGRLAWWVQEDPLEWLALTGHHKVLPTLEWLREHDRAPRERCTRKLGALLADPDRWLERLPGNPRSAE